MGTVDTKVTDTNPTIGKPLAEWIKSIPDFKARFWSKVNKDGPIPLHVPHLGQCWEWAGKLTNMGYGAVSSGREHGSKLAHRVSWVVHFGEIDGGLLVLHKCDNPKCVRPEHLSVGTHKDNSTDMSKKLRGTVGEKAHSGKLTTRDVIKIRELYASGTVTQTKLGEMYSVRQDAISRVVNRHNWRHV